MLRATGVPLGLMLFACSAWAQSDARPASFTPAGTSWPAKRSELPALTLPGAKRPAELPAALVEQRRRFDPHAVEVKADARHWQLWAGPTLLKDFGDQREAAFQARRLIADLNLNERGTIGTPDTVLEYWLADGQPPRSSPSIPRGCGRKKSTTPGVSGTRGRFCTISVLTNRMRSWRSPWSRGMASMKSDSSAGRRRP
jgi:hypothetical protein